MAQSAAAVGGSPLVALDDEGSRLAVPAFRGMETAAQRLTAIDERRAAIERERRQLQVVCSELTSELEELDRQLAVATDTVDRVQFEREGARFLVLGEKLTASMDGSDRRLGHLARRLSNGT